MGYIYSTAGSQLKRPARDVLLITNCLNGFTMDLGAVISWELVTPSLS